MNNLKGLTDILFEQLRRLDNEDLPMEAMEKEIKRSDAIVKVATVLVNTGDLALKAKRIQEDNFRANTKLPALFTETEKENANE